MFSNASRLSVGIITDSISRLAGGLFNSVRKAALALSAHGCDITVYGVEDAYSAEDLAAWSPILPHVYPARGPRALGYAPGIAEALAVADHDLLHLHGLWQYSSIATLSWRRRTERPVMISPRGMLDPWAVANSGLKKRLALVLFERANLRGATCIHALNNAEEIAVRSIGLNNHVVVIPNGTEIPALPAPPTPSADQEKRTLLFLGRLHFKKGLHELLAAWALLKKQAPGVTNAWQLKVVGWDDGHYGAILRRRAEELGLLDDVKFIGAVFDEAKSSAFLDADAFILPSYSEGMPMAVLEAWSYGLPVFMTAECNLPEGFVEGAAVQISNAPERLATDLQIGLSRGDLLEVGARGRALVAANFSWQTIAARYLDVYRWMMDSNNS